MEGLQSPIGTLKIIAAIEHPTVITKILAHSTCPPGRRPDPRRGHSIYSKWPDPQPTPDSIRFSLLSRPSS